MCLKIAPRSVVVVVLPLVPVIAASGTSMKCAASSISLMISIPAFCAASSCGRSMATPGETTIRSLARKVAWSWRSSSRSISKPASSASGPASWVSLRRSVTVTRAPFEARKRAQATPVLARPTTRIFLFFNSMNRPYRILSVEIATRAKIIVMIQKRTMILGSATPFNSKW